MNDLGEPSLTTRIHTFMDRKDREHPELRLLETWGKYEYTPQRSFGRTSKH